MDIHRCRFVPYPPSAINAVAFNYAAPPKGSARVPVRLAVGRANGDIEIWNPLGGLWHHELTLHGGKDRSIDGLVWVNEPSVPAPDGSRLPGRSRLFSIGYTSTVTEWDLEKGRPKKQASGMHGDIWCIAAQPEPAPTSRGGGKSASARDTRQRLVAGTMDGSLVLYSIDDGDLHFDRVLVRSTSKKSKMVCLTFQNRNTVVVGCSDSAIRVYDMRSGQVLRKMTLGSDLKADNGGAREIIVWSVRCLGGRDIVSGDSTGQVCVWDGATYSLAQRLQSHKQDVLSLATSHDGRTIVSGGMDRKTVVYRQSSGHTTRWAKVWHRRYHAHDVKTMAVFEGNGLSVLVSGGPDAAPVVLPLDKAGREYHRSLGHLPQQPPVRSAPNARVVLSWWDRQVHIWRLKRPLSQLVDANADPESGVAKNRKLLARILIKGEANITSAAVNHDASLLVVATTSDIKAFHLAPSPDASSKDDLAISRVDVPASVAARGAAHIDMSPDGQWLCLIHDGSSPSILRIASDPDPQTKPTIQPRASKLQRIRRQTPKHNALAGLGGYDRSITRIAFSPDSKMLAVADLAGYVDTWVLTQPQLTNGASQTKEVFGSESSDSSDDEGDEDDSSSGPRWTRNPNGALIPRLASAPTVLSFSEHVPQNPGSGDDDDYVLLTITAKPQVLLVHPTRGALADWSRRNPVSRFPAEFRNIRDLVRGALWAGDRVWLYGNNYLAMLDLSQDMSGGAGAQQQQQKQLVAQKQQGRKRKRGPDTGAGSKVASGHAAGPTRVVRHAPGQAPVEVEVDGGGGDPMDTDNGASGPGEEDEDEDSEDDEEDDDEAAASDSEGSDDELAALRKLATRITGPDGEEEERPVESKGAGGGKGPAFWHTYKYRPILGIVPLRSAADGGSSSSSSSGGLEVALVERPAWDVDMPDRYFADGEWER